MYGTIGHVTCKFQSPVLEDSQLWSKLLQQVASGSYDMSQMGMSPGHVKWLPWLRVL